jgi:hypothetical protein
MRVSEYIAARSILIPPQKQTAARAGVFGAATALGVLSEGVLS